MFTPRRNQRSKGFKVKHALQLLFLLGVCIWLLYQLRRSHEKETALIESSKLVDRVAKLGRKDLRPQREEISVVDARHKEDEGDEVNKNDEHNIADETDNNDVGNSNEDDETHLREHGLDKDEDADHGQETVDQDKETETGNETADAEIENEEHNAKVTEETESEEKKEDKSSADQTGENEENVTEKIEANDSDSTDDVSTVSQLEDNTESGDKESDDSKAEEDEQKEETEKEEENNVDQEQGENDVKDSEEPEKDEKDEDEQQKIEDPITSDDHVQDGSDRKVEEAREEHYIKDNASSAVDHLKQHEPGDNSTESDTKSADVVDGTHSQSIANVTELERDKNYSSSTNATNRGDSFESEAKRVDGFQVGSITESHHQLLEKDNSVSSDTLNSSVQNGADSTSNMTDKQFAAMHNTTSEGDNHDLQNTEIKKTHESGSDAGNDQSDSTSTTSGATDGEDAGHGEFKNSTTNPDLQNSTESNKSVRDESYSATRETDEPSRIEKPDSNSTTGGEQENVLSSETNDDVHTSKDGNLTSSEYKANDGENTPENQETGRNKQIDSSNKLSLQDDGSTEQNVNDDSKDENVTSSENSANDGENAKENQEAGQDEQIRASDKSTLQDNGNSERNVNENAVETMTDENENATQNESSPENVNDDAGQDDQSRSIDSSLPQDVKEAHVDLETLPAEGNHIEI